MDFKNTIFEKYFPVFLLLPYYVSIECDDCGELFYEHELTEVSDGDSVCTVCLSNNFIKCYECHEYSDKDNAHRTYANDLICDSCFDSHYFTCHDCSDIRHNDDGYEARNHIVCQPCYEQNYFRCHSCDNVYVNSLGCTLGHYTYCEECFADVGTSCSSCGENISNDNVYHDDDGDDYCHECYDERNNEAIIHSYAYKPSPVFYGKTETGLYFGFELEVENHLSRCQNKDAAEQAPDFCYCKRDGSLHNGFEIVSHPVTFQWLKENSKAISSYLKYLSENGFRSFKTSTCGMHVHVSKRPIGSLVLYKILRLFYDAPDFILKVSQREEPQFRQWCGLSDGESLVLKAKDKKQNVARYAAINLSNSNTIEFRIFRGTLSFNSFMKNMDFVDAVIQYAGVASVQSVCPYDFISYVQKNRALYKNLNRFLSAKLQTYYLGGIKKCV